MRLTELTDISTLFQMFTAFAATINLALMGKLCPRMNLLFTLSASMGLSISGHYLSLTQKWYI